MLALVLGVAIAGCSPAADEPREDDSPDGAAPVASPPIGEGDRVPFDRRLSLLPRSLAGDAVDGAGILVQVADLDRAAMLAEVEPPANETDEEAVNTYLRALQGLGVPGEPVPQVATLLPELASPTYGPPSEFAAEVGWSVLDVSWFVEFPTPPVRLAVLGGDFDEEQITAVVGPPEDELWRVGEGEDLSANLDDRNAARPLGQPMTMALTSDWLAYATAAAPVADLRAGGETLGDVEELRLLATLMEEAGAYSAMLSVAGAYPGGGVGGQPVASLEAFQAIGVGLVHDGQPSLVLGYIHADAATAEANAETLRTLVEQGQSVRGQPWSEQLDVDRIDVRDTTVVAHLELREGTHPMLGYQLLRQRDSLAVHQ